MYVQIIRRNGQRVSPWSLGCGAAEPSCDADGERARESACDGDGMQRCDAYIQARAQAEREREVEEQTLGITEENHLPQ